MHRIKAVQSNLPAATAAVSVHPEAPSPHSHIHAQAPPIITGVAAPASVFGLAASHHAFAEFIFTVLHISSDGDEVVLTGADAYSFCVLETELPVELVLSAEMLMGMILLQFAAWQGRSCHHHVCAGLV